LFARETHEPGEVRWQGDVEGFGAGGIGVALDTGLNNLYWDQVGLCLLVIFVVVIATEIATSTIRSRII